MSKSKFKAVGSSTLTPIDNRTRKEIFASKNPIQEKSKKVTRIYWTYGSEQTPLEAVSRFYVDLNIHIDTENYDAGDSVEVIIEGDDVEAISRTQKSYTVFVPIDASGRGSLKDVFDGKQVEILGIN